MICQRIAQFFVSILLHDAIFLLYYQVNGRSAAFICHLGAYSKVNATRFAELQQRLHPH